MTSENMKVPLVLSLNTILLLCFLVEYEYKVDKHQKLLRKLIKPYNIPDICKGAFIHSVRQKAVGKTYYFCNDTVSDVLSLDFF